MATNEAQIIVLGSAKTSAEHFDELLAASQAHVRRSRTEPGCLAHAVLCDLEDPLRLVFVERWADRAALDTHFAEPDSTQVVEVIERIGIGRPTLDIYEADGPA